MEIERRQCGIKIAEMEIEINYMKDHIKEIKDDIKVIKDDIKGLIPAISEFKGKASMFGVIGGIIAGFLTAVMAYFIRTKN